MRARGDLLHHMVIVKILSIVLVSLSRYDLVGY